jgi:hypothetical protein
MSFLKKESKTHFVRDEAGKVIEVKRSGDEPKGAPVSKALMKQHYEKHPEQRPSAKAKKRIGSVVKVFDDYSLKYAKSHQGSRQIPSGRPQPPLGSYSFANNFNPIGDTFDSGRPKPKKKPQSSKKYAVVGGKAYLIASTIKKKKKKGKGGGKRRKYNPNDPFDFPDIF